MRRRGHGVDEPEHGHSLLLALERRQGRVFRRTRRAGARLPRGSGEPRAQCSLILCHGAKARTTAPSIARAESSRLDCSLITRHGAKARTTSRWDAPGWLERELAL